jgi:3-dehydroquinate dehydratase-2
MSTPIYILNGPNLNRLGTREPQIYGTTTLAEIEAMCREAASDHPLVFRQSNREYELIDWVHEAIDEAVGMIINPAAFTFTSMALMDALKMFPGPLVELHISNIHNGGDRRPRPTRLSRSRAGHAGAHGGRRKGVMVR